MKNFMNWLGQKLYNNNEEFRNSVYGLYYHEKLLPVLRENIDLKLKIKELENSIKNLNQPVMTEQTTQQPLDQITESPKPKKRNSKKKVEKSEKAE